MLCQGIDEHLYVVVASIRIEGCVRARERPDRWRAHRSSSVSLDWPSFFLGLLTFPVLISGLLLVRVLLELALVRRARKIEELHLPEDPVISPLASRAQ